VSGEGRGLLDPAFLARVERLSLQIRRVLRGERHGEKRNRRQGIGLLFAGHRGYVSGDDLRYLDWDLLARLDRPYMKRFEQETDLTVNLLIDASRSMSFGTPAKFTVASRLAAVLAYVALTSLDRVGVGLLDGSGVRLHGPGRGRGAFYPILRFLEQGRPVGSGPVEKGLRIHAAAGTPGLTVLFSDFLDPSLPAALAGHAHRRHELALIQVLCREEIDPPYDGDLRLLDSESGAPMEVTVGPRERNAYLRRLESHRESLRRFAVKHGAASMSIPSDLPLEQAVWDHLLRATFVEGR
jgi:uncharacterized protein (DUF58 family)